MDSKEHQNLPAFIEDGGPSIQGEKDPISQTSESALQENMAEKVANEASDVVSEDLLLQSDNQETAEVADKKDDEADTALNLIDEDQNNEELSADLQIMNEDELLGEDGLACNTNIPETDDTLESASKSIQVSEGQLSSADIGHEISNYSDEGATLKDKSVDDGTHDQHVLEADIAIYSGGNNKLQEVPQQAEENEKRLDSDQVNENSLMSIPEEEVPSSSDKSLTSEGHLRQPDEPSPVLGSGEGLAGAISDEKNDNEESVDHCSADSVKEDGSNSLPANEKSVPLLESGERIADNLSNETDDNEESKDQDNPVPVLEDDSNSLPANEKPVPLLESGERIADNLSNETDDNEESKDQDNPVLVLEDDSNSLPANEKKPVPLLESGETDTVSNEKNGNEESMDQDSPVHVIEDDSNSLPASETPVLLGSGERLTDIVSDEKNDNDESMDLGSPVPVTEDDSNPLPAQESEKTCESELVEASEHVDFADQEESQDKTVIDEDDDNLLGSLSQQNAGDQDTAGHADEKEDPLMNDSCLIGTDKESKDAEKNLLSKEGSKVKESDNTEIEKDRDVEMVEISDDEEMKTQENVSDVGKSNENKVDKVPPEAKATFSTPEKSDENVGSGSEHSSFRPIPLTAPVKDTLKQTQNSAEQNSTVDALDKMSKMVETVSGMNVPIDGSVGNDSLPLKPSSQDSTVDVQGKTGKTTEIAIGPDAPIDASSGTGCLPPEPSIVIEQVHTEADVDPNEDVEITGEIRPIGKISVVQGLFKPKPETDTDEVTAEEAAALSPKKTVWGKRTLVIIHCGKIVEGFDELKVASCAECKMTKDVLYEITDGSGEFPICSQACFLEYERTSAICRILKVNFQAIDKEPLPDLSSDWSGIRNHANKCSFCHTDITSTTNSLSWETMEFCSVKCVNDYQQVLGSNCVHCKSTVRASYMGKYCVRFGRELKQFCCNDCLERYKPSVKICAYCQRDITQFSGSSCLAQIGDTGNFKDFCSAVCIVKYDDLLNLENLGIADCTVCKKNSQVRAKIDFDDKTFVLCSDPCISAFKFVNQIKADNCDTCSKLVDKEKDKPFSITHYSGSKKIRLFCSQGCLNRFVTHNRQIVSCSWCRVKKYNFDLIRVEDMIGRLFFCSVVCLNQHVTVKLRKTLCSVCPNQADPRSQMNTATGVAPLCPSPDCREKWKERFAVNPIITSVSSLRVAPPQALTLDTTPVAASAAPAPIMALPQPVAAPPPIPAKVPVEVTQRVIFRQTLPPLTANKSTGCKPKMVSKGQYFQSPSVDVETQTDFPDKVVYVPVPVPIYVPAPMMMYSAPYPVPLPMPLPVPVPVFLPVTKRTHEEVAQFIEKIIDEIPNNPIEADLLAMAAMIANEAENEEKQAQAASDKPQANGTDSANHSLSNGKSSLDDDLLQMLASADIDPSELVGSTSLDASEVDFDSTVSHDEDTYVPKKGKKRGRSSTSSAKSKKKKKKEKEEEEETQRQSSSLKLEYGLNAWRKWVMQKNNELERIIASGKKGMKLFKTDLLKMTPEEVCGSLCFFVKEITKPDGVRYAPDSIYYLCLGIQQYLYENGRVDNIFADFYYERFSVHLDEVISEYVSARGDEAYLTSRIEEEHLWECRQLGAHSPQVLLYTLMYFNTKYFGLKTVEDHRTLSFVSVVKSWRRVQSGSLEGAKGSQITRLVTLKHLIPSKKKGEKPLSREMLENWENPLRCPVKLYEFYISKCPESARNRSDLYYICPERSCVPDSPVWYSTRQVTDEVIQRMINRTLLVRDVNESLLSIEDDS